MKKEHIYMTVKVTGLAWSEIPQTYLGLTAWSEGVKIAEHRNLAIRSPLHPFSNT